MIEIKLTDIPVHYINLTEHKDKNEKVLSLLTNLGFNNISRHEGEIHEKSNVGCSRAHYKALEQLEAPFILFEDDIVEKKFINKVNFPENADAVYLGTSSWGRFNSNSGPFLKYKKINNDLYRIYNMLSGHAILYLNDHYKEMCEKIAYFFGYVLEDSHQDIGYAEIQKYFSIYCFNDPLFLQTSNPKATNKKLTEYPIEQITSDEFFNPIDI